MVCITETTVFRDGNRILDITQLKLRTEALKLCLYAVSITKHCCLSPHKITLLMSIKFLNFMSFVGCIYQNGCCWG